MIKRPLHKHGVDSPERYAQLQAAFIAHNREQDRLRVKQNGPWDDGAFRDPFVVPEAENPPVYIGAGAWLVRCPCGDAPSADPEWRVARCFWCGRVFQNLHFPENRAAIEAVLLKRPNVFTMNMRPDETLEDLIVENLAHGIEG